MLDRPIVLSVDTLARITARIGELHVALAPPATWLPKQADEEADDRAREELAQLGGIDRRGRLDADLAATLALLCAPHNEFYGWITSHGRTIGVLAASTGRDAVLAVRTDREVHLKQSTPDKLAERLAAQVPEVPPGQGPSVTITPTAPTSRITAPARRSTPELDLARRIAALPTTGGGELHTAVRDDAGRRHAIAHPLRYADSTHGRWLNATLRDGRVLIAPASRDTLARRLHDAHRALT
ncbi:ESX secretion-associated protein EspG [Actinokineospora sp. NBRC 105648]|uniref:ESX secretion-associated protein EspG n=1 Tax=Actinokineospora sp. NBRC 105648 TaxID=3032206 RepID=UPI0024A426A2|nr:ESX secretion-associated protein EspG [Actinokineospora sp. NBRC 105648]GLZ40402.1 ESX secretion-associated protein EspG [Actinokineospora sp. NBRC 105648]